MLNKYHRELAFTLISRACKRDKECLQGFTLIELLVVIAIIGILTAISAFALNGSRETARDARRKTDLEVIRSALEIYKADCNTYPAAIPAVGAALTANCTGTLNTYLQARPGDPLAGRTYAYKTSGTPPTTYTLCAALEDVTVVDPKCSAAPASNCGSTCSYSAISP